MAEQKQAQEILGQFSRKDFQKILEDLLNSQGLSRLIRAMLFGGQMPIITGIKKNETKVGNLSYFGQAVVVAQEELFQEKKDLEKIISKEQNRIKKRDAEIKLSSLEREKVILSTLLRLIVDDAGGTATFGIPDVAIKNGDVIVRTDDNCIVFPFKSQ